MASPSRFSQKFRYYVLPKAWKKLAFISQRKFNSMTGKNQSVGVVVILSSSSGVQSLSLTAGEARSQSPDKGGD